MAAVFLALGLVIVFITMLPHLVARRRRSSRASPPRRSRQRPVGPYRAPTSIPDHTLVVIAAAVAEVVSEPHRILQTQPLRRTTWPGRTKGVANTTFPIARGDAGNSMIVANYLSDKADQIFHTTAFPETVVRECRDDR